MGSYLSIVNDTKDIWHCKLGPDEVAFKIAAVIVGVIGTITTVIATAGAAAPLATTVLASGAIGITGVTSAAVTAVAGGIATAGTYATVIGGVSSFGLEVAKAVSNNLKNDGYFLIPAGEKKRFGKMSLSLWQQGTCIKNTIVNEKTVRVETVYMRPIFSGATANSNNDHQISYWLKKLGAESKDVVATDIKVVK